MNARIGLVVLLAIPAAALAWGKKKEEAKPALPALKAGINIPCLKPLAEAKDPAGLLGMGMLDQTKGDLKAAGEKYAEASRAGNDVINAKVDLTLVNGVIWIQSEKCPVPVPAAADSASVEASSLKIGLQPHYPKALLAVKSEGVVKAMVWVGADGRAVRVHVSETSAGPSGMGSLILDGGTSDQRLKLEEENAERLLGRVQFALQAFEDLRSHDFGAAAAGKSFAWKLSYVPPKDMSENLPGRRVGDTGGSGTVPVQGLGN